MRSWIAHYRDLCVPIVTHDDGSRLTDKEQNDLYPSISFFSQGPEIGFGEKSVYHAQVRDLHFYPPNGFSGQLLTRVIVRDTMRRERCDELRCSYLNTVEITYYFPTYENPRMWKRVRYQGMNSDLPKEHNYAYLGNCEWWYSPERAQKEGVPTHFKWTDLHDSGTGCYLSPLTEVEGNFNQYILTKEQARRVLESASESHSAPAGLVSELYRNAMNSITCNTNSIANIAEIVDLIEDIRKGNLGSLVSDIPTLLKRKQIKKAAASSWLGYRYAYNTTRSDIAEYRDKLALATQNKKGSHIVRAGSSLPEGEMHVKVAYCDRSLNAAQDLYVMLKRTGLFLDLYNAWDMVPLSFVADWFLPIGDYLEDFSSNWVANAAIFDIHTVTTSWKWNETIRDTRGGYDISYYSRSVSTEPPEFESYSEDPSTKTVLKRVVDAAALIIG